MMDHQHHLIKKSPPKFTLWKYCLSFIYLLVPLTVSSFALQLPSRRFVRPNINKPLKSTTSNDEAPADKKFSASLDHPHTDTSITFSPIATPLSKYLHDYDSSINSPNTYWLSKARHYLSWIKPPTKSLEGGLIHGDVRWFSDGILNMCYNAIDRHPHDKVAMIFEADEPSECQTYTYGEMLREISQIANALIECGVRKGDVVTIYLPMIPLLPMTMLACARIGAVHSVVFGGFSSEALRSRIVASQSRFLVSTREGRRGGKTLDFQQIWRDSMDKLENKDDVKALLFDPFHQKDKEDVELGPNEVDLSHLKSLQRPYCPPEPMSAESPLFILYTSGSTGTPKGMVHTTGGYALYAAMTTQLTFNLQPNDIFACVADCGWITGHSYVTYGPLLNGGTTVVFESVPTYPDAGRYWDMIQRHKINVFYTAPTAIRSLMRFGDSIPKQYDLSSLRVLGTVGEPINPEAWKWYYTNVGNEKCTVVDTYWQTETGGHIVTPQANLIPTKPGSCSLPFYGIQPIVLDPVTGKELEGNDVQGVMAIKSPWPGMARTCLFDHPRYIQTYLSPYPGYYFTGDAVLRDPDGYYWILGRTDDVLNTSGHRIGTAEVESALVSHKDVAQAAVVGFPHDVKGEGIACFVTLTNEAEESEELVSDLVKEVRTQIGPFATPDMMVVTEGLPMTRSGKIMRRVLRKLVRGDGKESLGDTSTLADPAVVDSLIEKVNNVKNGK